MGNRLVLNEEQRNPKSGSADLLRSLRLFAIGVAQSSKKRTQAAALPR
jgi:hypothetical protein